MRFQLSGEDEQFLRTVQGLVEEGLSQVEIAERLRVGVGKLRYRLSKLGFELVSTTEVRTTLTGQSLTAFLASLPQSGRTPAGVA